MEVPVGLMDWLRGSSPGQDFLEAKHWTTDEPIAEVSPALMEAIKWGELETGYGAIYRAQPSVYTVVEFLAWQISQVGLKVYKRVSDTDREHMRGDAVSKLLDEPAPGLTYERFMHAAVADIGVFGNSYWLKVGDGPSRALLPLRPFNVEPRGGNAYQAATYVYTAGAAPVVYDKDEIVHFRRYNPDDLRIGISPLAPLRRILSEESESSLERVGFWRNSARLGGVIERPPDQPWSQETLERFRSAWESTYSGARNTGKTAILEDGMTFKPASWSPKDAEFIEGRKLTLETVARAFNIPLSVLGLTQTATFASQREFHKALYQDTLGPWLKMLQGEIELGVVRWLTSDPDVYVEFNLEEKLRGSFDEQADVVRAYGGVPIMTPNELRARFNLPAIPDERFDLPVMPANVLYGGVGAPGETPMPETPDEPRLRVASFTEAEGR